LKALKYYGYKRLFLSGGFTFFGNWKKELGLIMFTLMN
jgi:hypothetical protein